MIDKFINIFEGLSSAYGQFRKDNNRLAVKVEGKSFIVKEPVTKELWQNHLNGTGPNLGIFPLTREGTCKWGAIDIDVNNFDYEDLLNRIRKQKLPLIMFRSKSGRAHVYMFMKDFTPAQEVQLVMNKFAAKLGLGDMLDRVYPMQTSLGKNDFGSWLNMPYYNQEETSTCAYKDNFDGATIEEFFEMYDKYVQTDLSQHLVEEVKQNIKKPKEKTLEDFLLPCTKNCLKLNNNKIPDENRNDYLLHMYTWSLRAVEKGVKKIPEYSKMDAETLLKYFNQEYMVKPVEEKEIQNTVFKSKDKEYKYLCKKPTIKKYCDSSACTRHVCGITPLDAEKLVKATQALGKITKYLSEPPIFFESVDVKNENGSGYKRIRIEMQGEDIINKQKWLNKLANQGCFPHISLHEQKSSDFLVMQYERIENCLHEAADEEASEDFEFKSIIYAFVNKMTVSYNKEDLLKNACYVNKDTHELDFKLPSLMEYLKSNHIKIPANQLTLKLKKIMGAKKVNGTVYDEVLDKQRSYPTWRFKSDTDKYVVQITGSSAKQIEHDQEN